MADKADTSALEIKEQGNQIKENEREAARRKKEAADNVARRQDMLQHYADKGWPSWSTPVTWERIGGDLDPDQQEDEHSIKSNSAIKKLQNGVYKRIPELIDGKNFLIKVSGDKDEKTLSIVDGPRLNPLNNYFEKCYSDLLSLLQAKTGADTITIEYTEKQLKFGIRIPELKKIMEIAKEKGMEVKFGPNLAQHLETRSKNIYEKVGNALNRFKSAITKDQQDEIEELREETVSARQKKVNYNDLHKNQLFGKMKDDLDKKPSIVSELDMNIKADPSKVDELVKKLPNMDDAGKVAFLENEFSTIEASIKGASVEKLKELKEKQAVCEKVLAELPQDHAQLKQLKDKLTKVNDSLNDVISKNKPSVAELAKKLIADAKDDNGKVEAVNEQLAEIESRLKSLDEAKDAITKHGAAVKNAFKDSDSGFTGEDVQKIRQGAEENRNGLFAAIEKQKQELQDRAEVCKQVVAGLSEGEEKTELEERIQEINNKIDGATSYPTETATEALKKEEELEEKRAAGNLNQNVESQMQKDIDDLKKKTKATDYDNEVKGIVEDRVQLQEEARVQNK